MTMHVEVSRTQQWMLVWAAAIAAVYFRVSAHRSAFTPAWNRLDRYAPFDDEADGSFPASDPPSNLPTGVAR
jgi:hypothetical protein